MMVGHREVVIVDVWFACRIQDMIGNGEVIKIFCYICRPIWEKK